MSKNESVLHLNSTDTNNYDEVYSMYISSKVFTLLFAVGQICLLQYFLCISLSFI